MSNQQYNSDASRSTSDVEANDMARNGKDPVLVVVNLGGGNDFMNTIIPFTNPIYRDIRPVVAIPDEDTLPLNDTLGFHPSAGPLKELYDRGDVAIVQGTGYPDSDRSHFRAQDIWQTCEPVKVGTEGWLGRAVRDLDPGEENVLTAVNVGRGLPRALAMPGVAVTSVGDLDSYGMLSGIIEQEQRYEALQVFKNIYAPAIGTGPVTDYLARTGLDVLKGADTLKQVPAKYKSNVEYADNVIAKRLRDVARIHLADLGTRIFHTAYGGWDTHATELKDHARLLGELSGAIMDFLQDLKDHGAAQEVVMLLFTEFGRRMKDNGSGTDHGSGGGMFIIGERVDGGLYSEYPSLDPSRWEKDEDLGFTIDYRGVYSSVLEQWLGLPPSDIVGGSFEQIPVFSG